MSLRKRSGRPGFSTAAQADAPPQGCRSVAGPARTGRSVGRGGGEQRLEGVQLVLARLDKAPAGLGDRVPRVRDRPERLGDDQPRLVPERLQDVQLRMLLAQLRDERAEEERARL